MPANRRQSQEDHGAPERRNSDDSDSKPRWGQHRQTPAELRREEVYHPHFYQKHEHDQKIRRSKAKLRSSTHTVEEAFLVHRDEECHALVAKQVTAASMDPDSPDSSLWRMTSWAERMCGRPLNAVGQIWASQIWATDGELERAFSSKSTGKSGLSARSLGRMLTESWLASRARKVNILEDMKGADAKQICGLLTYLEMVVTLVPGVSAQRLTCIWELPEPAWVSAMQLKKEAELAAAKEREEMLQTLKEPEPMPSPGGVEEGKLIDLDSAEADAADKKSQVPAEPPPDPTQRDMQLQQDWSMARSFKFCQLGEERLFRRKLPLLGADINTVRAGVDDLNRRRARDWCSMVYNPSNRFYYCLYRKGARLAALGILGIQEPCGFLSVSVVAGYNLRNAGGARDRSDPYAVCRVGREEFRTRTVQDNLHPAWNSEEFQFKVNIQDVKQHTLHITVWDENPGKSDVSLGTGHLDLSTIERNQKHKKILPLMLGGVGQVEIELEFVAKLEYSAQPLGTPGSKEPARPFRRRKPSWNLFEQEMVYDKEISNFLKTIKPDSPSSARNPNGYQAKLAAYINYIPTATKAGVKCECGNFFLPGAVFCQMCGLPRLPPRLGPGSEEVAPILPQLTDDTAVQAEPSKEDVSVSVFLTIDNANYDALMKNTAVRGAFESAIKKTIAQEAGADTLPEHVDLQLSAGSVIVQAKVTPPNVDSVSSIKTFLLAASEGLANKVAGELRAVPGIDEVVTMNDVPGMDVGDITVTNISIDEPSHVLCAVYLPIVLNDVNVLVEETKNRWQVTPENFSVNPNSNGIAFRKTKRIADYVPGVVATWNRSLDGIDEGDGWVRFQVQIPRIQTSFLPVALNGVVALVKQGENRWKATVENFAVKPSTDGIAHRRSKNLADHMAGTIVTWGDTFNGFDEGDGWVRLQIKLDMPQNAASHRAKSDKSIEEDNPPAASVEALVTGIALRPLPGDAPAIYESVDKFPMGKLGHVAPGALVRVTGQAVDVNSMWFVPVAPRGIVQLKMFSVAQGVPQQPVALSVNISHGKNLKRKLFQGTPTLSVLAWIPGKPGAFFETSKIKALDPAWQEEKQIDGFEVGDTLEFRVSDKDAEMATGKLTSQQVFPYGFDDYMPLSLDEASLRITVSYAGQIKVAKKSPSGQLLGGSPKPRGRLSRASTIAIGDEAAVLASLQPPAEDNQKQSRRQRILSKVGLMTKTTDKPEQGSGTPSPKKHGQLRAAARVKLKEPDSD